MRTHFVIASSTTCHSEEQSDVAIPMKLNTRRRTAVATAMRLPRYARNDKVGARERRNRIAGTVALC